VQILVLLFNFTIYAYPIIRCYVAMIVMQYSSGVYFRCQYCFCCFFAVIFGTFDDTCRWRSCSWQWIQSSLLLLPPLWDCVTSEWRVNSLNRRSSTWVVACRRSRRRSHCVLQLTAKCSPAKSLPRHTCAENAVGGKPSIHIRTWNLVVYSTEFLIPPVAYLGGPLRLPPFNRP